MSILKWRGQESQMSLRGFQGAAQNDDPSRTGTKPCQKRGKPVYRPATALEVRGAEALRRVTFVPGTAHKRFARSLMHGYNMITEKQAAYLWYLIYRYRRQIPSTDLVEHARRLTQPNTDGAFLQ